MVEGGINHKDVGIIILEVIAIYPFKVADLIVYKLLHGISFHAFMPSSDLSVLQRIALKGQDRNVSPCSPLINLSTCILMYTWVYHSIAQPKLNCLYIYKWTLK